jgi:2-(1,2-epoxy-1,2-dihydrophenyl)acetyl-CoA isomerase
MTVRYEVQDGVAVVTFNRPDVLNAFDEEMGRAALKAIDEAAEDADVRCIVITGEGRAFSSGEDLGALAAGYKRGETPPLGDILTNRYNPMIRAITGAPKPVVAAVNGVAAGAGASVALACDYRIAAEEAKFILAFVKVGLVPDSGALWFLERALGTARAWQLASTGEPLDAEEALGIGLVTKVVPAEQLEKETKDFASGLAAGPTRAYALIKKLLYGATDRSLHDQLEAEIDAQTEAGRSQDHLEGVQAFFEKRPPKFRGE